MPRDETDLREQVSPTSDPDAITLISQASINEGDAKSARHNRTVITWAASIVLVVITLALVATLFVGGDGSQEKAWQGIFLIIGGIGGFLFGKKMD
ncbi:MAG: hypothetical protein DHS20C03_34660 [Minwuia thermotolerans]|nr:MAG: hypothetical protein DHS20C03_34660 [Minwuia thermotolerans]